MAERIVDGLEAVDIDEGHHERLVLASCPGYLPFKLHKSRSPLVGTRQIIV